MIGSVSPSSVDQILREMHPDNPMARDLVGQLLGMSPGQLDQTLQQNQQLVNQAQGLVNMGSHTHVDLQRLNGSAPGRAVHASSPPRGQGGQRAQSGRGYSTYNIGSNDTVKLDDGREFSGQQLQSAMDRASPEVRQAILDRNPALQLSDSGLLQVRTEGAGMAAVAPGRVTAQQAASGQQAQVAAAAQHRTSGQSEDAALGFLGRMNGWKGALAGLLTGGIGGAVVGGVVGSTVGRMARGMTATGGGGSTGGIGGLNAGALGAGGMGVGGGFATGGTMMASMMGLDGMAFQMKKQAKAIAHDMGDQAMIGMINNKGIPIEDLIFMFMAYMANKYEDRLRDKMEEAAMAERMERRREMQQDRARMISGVLAAFGPAGAIAGTAITMGTQKKMEIEAALNGGGKSSTILMSEVQMLMQKWKQLNEMLSNLMKSIHDMAMTPIRNLR